MERRGFSKIKVCKRCLKNIEGARASYRSPSRFFQDSEQELCPSCLSISSVERSWMPVSAGSLISKIFFVPDKHSDIDN